MIIAQENVEVTTSGVQESNQFSISCNREMFQMLSSGVYKDKIRAVIRELSTNALDAHIDAGVERAFKVVLPNSLEPNFSVRDFGNGMSEDDVMVLYSSYGESTKRLSNAFNGALGIGSKSPFAYADAFSVVSRHEGMKKTYSLYVDNGMPTISKMAECEMTDEDEGTGLEVIVPVEDKDYHTFKSTAQKVYQWFSVRPECNEDLTYITLTDLLTAKDGRWSLYVDNASDYYSKYEGIYVVMANVIYPVDVVNLNSDVKKLLGKANLMIKVETGDVRMAASRESLSMTEETTQFLNTRIMEISEELTEVLTAKLEEETEHFTEWNKRIFVGELKDTYKLSDLIEANFDLVDDYVEASTHGITVMQYNRYGRPEQYPYHFSTKPSKNTRFYQSAKEYNSPKGAVGRHAKRQSVGKNILLVRPVGMSWEIFESNCAKFLKELGNPDIQTLESVGHWPREVKEKVVREKGEKRAYVKLADATLSGIKIGEGSHGLNIYCNIQASCIEEDESITKVVYFPSTGQYFSGSKWEPFATRNNWGTSRTYTKEYKGDSARNKLAGFISDQPAMAYLRGQGIVFCTLRKSDRALLKWSNKFVCVHDFIKSFKNIPVKVPHKDIVTFAAKIGESVEFGGGQYKDLPIHKDKAFRDLADWYVNEGLRTPTDAERMFTGIDDLFGGFTSKITYVRPKGFNLPRMLKKYELWPHLSGAGKVTFLKTITKTYSHREEEGDIEA